MRPCLASRKEPDTESIKTLWNCDTSVLNFYLRESEFSLLGKTCQAVISVGIVQL